MSREARVVRAAIFLLITAIIVILSYLVSIRGDHVGTDTYSYKMLFYSIANGNKGRISEPFFLFLSNFSASVSDSHEIYFFIISIVSSVSLFLVMYAAYVHMQKERGAQAMVFLILLVGLSLTSPFYGNSQINLIRTGIGLPFLIGSLGFLYSKKYLYSLVALLCAVMLHYSFVMFLPFLILVGLSSRVVFVTVMALSVLYAAGLPELVFAKFSDIFYMVDGMEYYSKYEESTERYRAGVRYDFLFFTLFFFVIAYLLKEKGEASNFAFKAYSTLICPFLVIGFIAYSDRLLLAAWVFIPFVLSAWAASSFGKSHMTLLPATMFLIFAGAWFGYQLIEVY